jgi:hypothetical protein
MLRRDSCSKKVYLSTLESRDHFLRSREDGIANREWTEKFVANLVHAPGSANVAR